MSLFRTKSANPKIARTQREATIEVIFAGSACARYLVLSLKGSQKECVCGVLTSEIENPANHHNLCPVARWFAAVEGMKSEVL
jgi:hypothetical protein